jgi:cation:H+ antiporter
VREHENNKRELKKAVTGYVFNAVLVILAALFLPVFGEALAAQGGMGNTFFGTLFLAASTSMPEVVVSLMAIRLRAFDMAVGNILGSNIFNIFILAIDDVFYASGSLFRAIDHNHIISIMFVTLMTAIAGLGMMTKSGRTFWKLGADTLVILILYLCLLSILFLSE